MKKNVIVLVIAVCFLFICTYPAPAAAGGRHHKRFSCNDKVKVMTRNLYLGADIFQVLLAAENPDPELKGLDVPVAVAELFQTVQYTNFPERADAIAKEIWITRPHLIGLQEVSKWYIQSPGDFLILKPGGAVPNLGHRPAEEPIYDYLAILMDKLAARGLHYEVAVSIKNADVELPMLTGFIGDSGEIPTFDDLRLVDYDVILVRTDVDVSNPMAANYVNNVSVTISGAELKFTRGWTAIDAEVCGEIYRFVNTHLEISSIPQSSFRVIQSWQMEELLAILSYETKPILLVGDFNSSPEHEEDTGCLPYGLGCYPYVPPYKQVIEAGYLDAWDLIFWPRDGFTSGFDEFVSDPTAELTERIDLVLVKPQDKEIKNVIAVTTSDKPFSMTPGGLWPSDHAGVVARIRFASPY